MRIKWLASTAAVLGLLSASHAFAASKSMEICALLTREELATVGVVVSELQPEEPTLVKKGSIPGLNSDMETEECASEFANLDTFSPVSWSVVTTKEPIDKKTIDQIYRENTDNKDLTRILQRQHSTIDGVDCETSTWPGANGSQLYVAECFAHKRTRHVTLEFTQRDKAQLPPVKSIKQLLDKILSRL